MRRKDLGSGRRPSTTLWSGAPLLRPSGSPQRCTPVTCRISWRVLFYLSGGFYSNYPAVSAALSGIAAGEAYEGRFEPRTDDRSTRQIARTEPAI